MSDHDTWNMFAAAVAPTVARAVFERRVAKGMPSVSDIAPLTSEIADALLAESKKRETPAPTPPQPDDDGWIKWEGGECPTVSHAMVTVKLRDGSVPDKPHPGDTWAWDHNGSAFDIVAYRIVSEAGAA